MNWANSKELLFPLPSLPPTYVDVSAFVSLPQVLHEGFLREWVQHHHVPAPYHLVQEVGVLLPTRTHHPLQRPRGHLCEINLLLDEWMCSKETNIIGRDFNLGLVIASQMLIQTGVLPLECSKTHSVSRLGVTDTSQHLSEHLWPWLQPYSSHSLVFNSISILCSVKLASFLTCLFLVFVAIRKASEEEEGMRAEDRRIDG